MQHLLLATLYMALFAFIFMAATLYTMYTLPFFKVFIITCFPPFFNYTVYSVFIFMYCIHVVVIDWVVGKRLWVNWLYACTVPEFRSVA